LSHERENEAVLALAWVRLGTGCLPSRGCVRNSSLPRPQSAPGRHTIALEAFVRRVGFGLDQERPLGSGLMKAGADCRPTGGGTLPIVWPLPTLFYVQRFSIYITRTMPYSFKLVVGTALAKPPRDSMLTFGHARPPTSRFGGGGACLGRGRQPRHDVAVRAFRARRPGVGGPRTDGVPGHALVRLARVDEGRGNGLTRFHFAARAEWHKRLVAVVSP
jgi:hypothetical protein